MSTQPTREPIEPLGPIDYDTMAEVGNLHDKLDEVIEWVNTSQSTAPAGEAKPSFKGTVTDSGGGMVSILVDRDTYEYPTEGETVEVSRGIIESLETRMADRTDAHPKPSESTGDLDKRVIELLAEYSARISLDIRDGQRPTNAIVGKFQALVSEQTTKARIDEVNRIDPTGGRHYKAMRIAKLNSGDTPND